jgi:hypothetical protein
MDIPVELFLGFIGTTLIMVIIGIARQPQIPALIVFAGMFLLTWTLIADNIIMGKIPDTSIVSGSTTTYTLVDNLYPFTEIVKVIFSFFSVSLMLVGALLTKVNG